MPLQLVVQNKQKKAPARKRGKGAPTQNQLLWLSHGLNQAGGKLPLFDENGRRVSERTVHSCLQRGWAKPWFNNPIKPDWLICGLTEAGRELFTST
ncbi:MAG: hypothetical protein HQ494_13540 [Rhodospirillales bacterium]|nr:hypothetical protein [Rhodospirillales bacterium]